MAAVNPYLNFDGNAEEVFNFYKSVFGGEFATIMRFGDVPAEAGGGQHSAEENKRILHIALPIGNTMLMGSDRPTSLGAGVKGTNFGISIMAESQAEADKIFNGLSAGGVVTMPMMDSFWGAYFGMCSDKYGIMWMINFQRSPM